MIRRILFSGLLGLLFAVKMNAQTWQQYRDKADVFTQQKNNDSALLYYTLSKTLLSPDSAITDTHIQLLSSIANLLYLAKSQYLKAEPFYLEAREVIGKKYGKKSDLYATNAQFLGQVNYFLKKYEPSENFYLEAKQIWEQLHGKKSKEYASSCNALGVLYNEKGEFEKAIAQHTEARAIRENLFTKENGSYAQSCNNLAAIYWSLGEYDKAEPLALEAKEIRGRVPGVPKAAYAISCVNLANIYRDMGKYQQAEPMYLEAKKVREEVFTREHDDYALSCSILADLYFFMKQYDKAEPLYIEARDIRKRISPVKSYFYGQSCSDLAQLYREMGRYQEAESLALEADTIWQELGASVNADMAINKNSLGALYFAMRKYTKAEEFFLIARDMWDKSLGEGHPYITSNSLSLARVYWCENQVARANDFYLKAFATQNDQADRMFSFTSEEEKQLYLQNIAGAEDEYQSFYFAKMSSNNKGQPYLISLLKRNQILSSSLQLRQLINSSGDTLLLNKYDEWTLLKKQIAALYAKGETAPKGHLNALIDKAAILEKDLVRSSADFKKADQAFIDWKAIQQQLKPSEAAIEFIEFNYFDGRRVTDSTYYAALVLRPGLEEPGWVTLFEKKQLDSLLTKKSVDAQSINRFYSRGLRVGNVTSSLSIQAYNTIWKPLESQLDGVTTIYFAPAGLLHRVAFASLAIDSAKVLSDRYRLVQLSTTARVADQHPDVVNAGDKIYLFGGIQYSTDLAKSKLAGSDDNIAKRNGFNYLPGTAMEVERIAETGKRKGVSPVVLQGYAAKESSIKQLSGNSSPKILHIATHGFFFPDPANNKGDSLQRNRDNSGKAFIQSDNPLIRSGLIFAGANDAWNGKYIGGTEDDGILTAFEVSNLYLPDTKLVVLSACETALGDIKGSEGVYGLQRAFKMAGVKNLVMSLWKVPDLETAEFMQLFYKNMFDGKAIDRSFYEAQTSMKNKYRKNPYKWAAWILVQ